MQRAEINRVPGRAAAVRGKLLLPGAWALLILAGPAGADYRFDAADDFLAPAEHWPAWSQTLERHAEERLVIRRCLSDQASCEGKLKSLRHVIVAGEALDRDRQLRLVNRYVNRRFYRRDRRRTTPSVAPGGEAALRNHWVTLLDFLKRGGDCEDYASAKYFLLRELGVPAEDMRVLVTWDRYARAHHAVLAVRREDGSSWLLESDNTIVRRSQRGYRFVYALNEYGVWDHAK